MKKTPVFIFIVIAIVFFVLGWFAQVHHESFDFLKYFEQPARTGDVKDDTKPGTNDGTVCAQVITPAINPETKEIREFPTPCDVPEGWDPIKNDVPGMDLEVQ